VDISPEAQNTQDTIHRPHEAQEEGRPKYRYFGPSLKGDQKKKKKKKPFKEELQSVDQKLKE
jgi:hypothetical protein